MGLEHMTDAEAHAKERLAPEEVAAGGLLAASHLHRYELAGDLCAGLEALDLCCGTGYGSLILAGTASAVHGVDVAEEALAAARATLPADAAVTFERADAVEFLRAQPQGRFGAVVCFEGIEHVPDPDALLGELSRMAEGGARVIVSLPNSRGFEEDNEFHVTDYGFESMQEAAARLGASVILEQYLAEASLLRPADAEGPLELRGELLDDPGHDPAWANHWLLLVNVEPAAVEAARARLALAASANHNAYMRQLERANSGLRRANGGLARQWLGVHDAAAAVVVRRLEERHEKESAEAAAWKAEARKWEEIAGNNAWAHEQLKLELAKPRYRVMDGARRIARRVSGIDAAARFAGRLTDRRHRRSR